MQLAMLPVTEHMHRLPRRKFSASGPAAVPASLASQKPAMFCYQCEQTEHGSGCTVVGVCGKTPQVAALQDFLVYCCKGISQYAKRARDLGASDAEVDRFVMKALFSTMTNVNFDPEAIKGYLDKASNMRDQAKTMYEEACRRAQKQPEPVVGPCNFSVRGASTEQLLEMAKPLGVLDRKAERGEDVTGLQEMAVYGLKGLCAYSDHASMLGREDPQVFASMHETLDAVTNPKQSIPDALQMALKVGQTNLRVMEMLDGAHTGTFGHPTPHRVSCTPRVGKAILVSGHDLRDLENVLKQTEGTGINVYTHGEMLPAHGYPGLRKYPHLAGHYGGPWQLQKVEFSQFPGAIVMTSNCLIEPRKSYKCRIFTRQVVGWPGVTHIEGDDYLAVIQAAQKAEGFTEEDLKVRPSFLTTGFARNTVLSLANVIVDAVKKGSISRFFLIGGCDGSEGERNYFRELALATPKDSVILTLGCGKYRFNRLELGNLPGTEIPRVLDMGQCNDAFSAISVASALAKAFNTDVNGLPLSFAVSWFEQKAVAVLLTLLSLSVKSIRLGPHLPGFASPAILNVLKEQFQVKVIHPEAVQADLQKMMAGQ